MSRKRFISIIIIVAGVFGACLTGISAMAQTKPGGGMNLLKKEMLALEETFQAIIDAVIFDKMECIMLTVPPLHKAREEVEKAINADEKIILPKNQDKFKEFIKLDDEFNKDFEALIKAAEKGHKKFVKNQAHKLLDACVVCHESFRNNAKTSPVVKPCPTF